MAVLAGKFADGDGFVFSEFGSLWNFRCFEEEAGEVDFFNPRLKGERVMRCCRGIALVLIVCLAAITPSVSLAFGGKVSYPDGTPATGAKVTLVDAEVGSGVAECDQDGRFQFGQSTSQNAQIQIKAPDGQDYAIVLPAAIFESGETAVVLQAGGN